MSKLLDVFNDVTKYGVKITTDNYLEKGRYPIIDQSQSFISGYYDNEEGLFTDVPAIIFGDHTRVIKYIDMPFFLGADGVKVLKAKNTNVDCKFLYYVLCNAEIPNTGYNRHFKWLKEVEIPLPSLEIQKQIATTLDKVTHTINICNEILGKLDLLVKSQFIKLTESDEEITPMRMGDIATYINGYAFKPTDWTENGNPIIRIQNLNDVSAKFNYYNGKLADKYAVVSGDVLVSWATHLEAYIWERGDAWLNQHIFKAVFDKIDIDKIYFVYATEKALKQAFKNAHGFKPTMEHIKRSDFENAIVNLPTIESQHKFADFVTQTDKSKMAIKKVLEKAETLKKALMQEYFG